MNRVTSLLFTIAPLVKNLLIILSVWAVKEAVTRLAFECYCLDDDSNSWWTSNDARELYSFLFLVVPAAFFWVAGACLTRY